MPVSCPVVDDGPGGRTPPAPELYGAVAPGLFGDDSPVGLSEGMLGVQPGGMVQILDCMTIPAYLDAGKNAECCGDSR